MKARLETEVRQDWASSASLCCVLEQDTFILAQEDLSRHNWKIVEWEVKNQIKQTQTVSFSPGRCAIKGLYCKLVIALDEMSHIDLDKKILFDEILITILPIHLNMC